jgi:hypothetical protein
MKRLEVEERLDSLINKGLKRLLFVRGIQSLAASPSTGSTLRLSSRPKAAA